MNETELLTSYRPWLRVVAANMTAPAQAEDLAQEGWIALWRALPSYDGRAPFDPWCKTVARNRMYNVIRESHAARRDERRLLTVGNVEDVIDAGAEVEGIELAYHQGEIATALAHLTAQQRDYVRARFWGGLTYTELNARFQMNSTGIWKWARRRLAAELEHLEVA